LLIDRLVTSQNRGERDDQRGERNAPEQQDG